MTRWYIEKSGTGIEKSGTGIEKSGTGIEKSGTGLRKTLLACSLAALAFGSTANAGQDGSVIVQNEIGHGLVLIGLFEPEFIGHHLHRVNGLDLLLAPVEFHEITNRRLTFQQKDHARDKIRGDLLQAEPQAHANGTPQNGQRGQGHAHDVHQHKESHAKDRDLGRFHRKLARGGAHLVLFLDELAGLLVGPSAKPEDRARHHNQRRK